MEHIRHDGTTKTTSERTNNANEGRAQAQSLMDREIIEIIGEEKDEKK